MSSTKKTHRLRNDDERHHAIEKLATERDFKSVSDYLNHLVDMDAAQHNFPLPPMTDYRRKKPKKPDS